MKKPKSKRIKERNEVIKNTLQNLSGSEKYVEVCKLSRKFDISIAMVYRVMNPIKKGGVK